MTEVGLHSAHLPLGLLSDIDLVPDTFAPGLGDRLVITSDGVWERHRPDDYRLTLEGIRGAIWGADDRTAAVAVAAIRRHLLDASAGPVKDEATVLAIALADCAG